MFLYRYNKYTDDYYQYDMDFYDIFSPMFDEFLHPVDDNFEFNYRMNPEFALTCAFCKTKFETRSQLFKHLGYMGINIKNKPADKELKKLRFKEDKGECGYFVQEKKADEDMIKPVTDVETLCHAFEDRMCLD